MPVTRHVERHFTSGETVRDIVIGMSDDASERRREQAEVRDIPGVEVKEVTDVLGVFPTKTRVSSNADRLDPNEIATFPDILGLVNARRIHG